MKHVSLTGLAFCFLAVPVTGQDPESDRPQFRVGVNTVSVAVTLLDEKGRLVTGLDEDNFTIFEDGVEQDIEFFAHGELPLKMVILLDVSTSMRQKLSMAQEAAIGFVGSLKPGDEVQVVEFGERVLTLVEFTSDFDDVANAIRSTKVKGAQLDIRETEGHIQRDISRDRATCFRAIVSILSRDNSENPRLIQVRVERGETP